MDCSPPGSSVHGILQGYWSGLPCPPPGDLPDLAIKPESLMSPALAGGFFTTNATWEAQLCVSLLETAGYLVKPDISLTKSGMYAF